MMLAGELRHLVNNNGSRRHVDTDCQSFSCEHHLHQPTHKKCFNNLLERGHHAGVVGCYSRLDLSTKCSEAECCEVIVAQACYAGIHNFANLGALNFARKPYARFVAHGSRFVTLIATEYEVNRWQ